MPSIRLYYTGKARNKISPFGPVRKAKQDKIEARLVQIVVNILEHYGHSMNAVDIEILWILVDKSRNSVDYGVELQFSEKADFQGFGLVTTPGERKILGGAILDVLRRTTFLPNNVTIGVWVKPQTGAVYTMTGRK